MRPSRMPGRSNHGAIHLRHAPIAVPGGIALLLQFGQDTSPDAGPTPAVAARSHWPPGAICIRQLAPGSSRPQPPDQAIAEGALVLRTAAAAGVLGGGQGPHPA